jgi:small-conductance mechanosensitive channel
MNSFFSEVMQNAEQIFFWGSSAKQWIIALAILLLAVVFFKIIFWSILRHFKKVSKKTVNKIDDFAVKVIKSIKPPVYYVVAIYLMLHFLNIPEFARQAIHLTFIVILIWQAAIILLKVTDFIIDTQIKRINKTNSGQKTILKFLKQVINGAIWVVGALMILANMGVNVSSLIAGLGIGGLAVALALKNILTDIFSSFSILIDKPFVVGDYIGLSDTQQGTVKKIGIKTTRLETRDGQELIIANKKLTEQVVQNFRGKGGKKKRNISFVLGVTYETSTEKLESIPQLIKDIIKKQENADLEKVAFDNFGDFSLNFKILIAINEKEGVNVTAVKNDINYAIFKAFSKEKIDFAYPTQTIQLANNKTQETRNK